MEKTAYLRFEYLSYVPEEIISELHNELRDWRPEMSKNRPEPQANLEHFNFLIPAAITAFFQIHGTGITDGLIVYAFTKALEKAYDKLIKKDKTAKIVIEYKDEKCAAIFFIDKSGKHDTDTRFEKIGNTILDGTIKKDFENNDYKSNTIPGKLRYDFDEKSQLWLPVNFQKRREDALKEASEFDH